MATVRLPLLLLAGVLATAFSCFQCNSKLVNMFTKIRKNVLPTQVRDSKLRSRCEVLLKGMASNFFRDYAEKHSAGIIQIHHYNTLVDYIETEAKAFLLSKDKDEDFLDALATFRKNITTNFKSSLKVYHDKACSPTECGWLQMKVFNCRKCKTVKPSCLSRRACMVDEERFSLIESERDMKAAMLSKGLSMVGISALALLIPLSLLTLMYWMRKKLLIGRTMLV